jgi:hypothetical protein
MSPCVDLCAEVTASEPCRSYSRRRKTSEGVPHNIASIGRRSNDELHQLQGLLVRVNVATVSVLHTLSPMHRR